MLSGRIQSSTLETKGCRRVRFPVYFWKPSSSFCLFFFEVNRCSNIVVPLRGVHSWFAHSALFQAQLKSCIRLWIHYSFRFCFMEVELDTQWSLRGMSVQRDGSPRKACWTLRILNSKGSEHALSVLKLEHRTMVPIKGWLVNRAVDGAEPDWGTATMRCLSRWEREWNVLLFFSLLVNVFSVIVKAYDAK